MDTKLFRAFTAAGFLTVSSVAMAQDNQQTASLPPADIVVSHDGRQPLDQKLFLQYDQPTSIPLGHSDFCEIWPQECSAQSEEYDVVRADKISILTEVNQEVNESIYAITDQEFHGIGELWVFPVHGYVGEAVVKGGDCEDFVLLKRKKLRERGIPDSAMSIAVVRHFPTTDNNDDGVIDPPEGHAVLIVRTEKGDFVLDNQTPTIFTPAQTSYEFIKASSFINNHEWQMVKAQGTVVSNVPPPRARPDFTLEKG